GQHGKWAVDQMYGDELGILMLVAGGEGLSDTGDIDGNGRFHSVFIVFVHGGATAPGHEFGVSGHIGHQVEHLGAAMRNQDRSLYFMHRKSLMDRMYGFY